MDKIVDPNFKLSEEHRKKCVGILIANRGFYMVWAGFVTNWIHIVFNGLLSLASLYMLSYTAIYAFFVLDDLEITAQSIYFTIILLCLEAMIIFIPTQLHVFRAIVRLLADGIYHYHTLDPETIKEINLMTETMAKRKNRCIMTLEILFSAFFFNCAITFPILAGKFEAKEYDPRYEGINRQAFLHMWMFFPSDTWPGWITATVFEYYMGFIVVCLLNGGDLLLVGFAEELVNHLNIFGLTILQIRRRACYLYDERFGKTVESYRSKHFIKCVEDCLKDSVEHHKALNRFHNLLNRLYSAPCIMVMCTGALLICMSGMIFFSKRVHLGTKLAFMLYLFGSTVHISIFSYYGEQITQSSIKNRNTVYEMEWEIASKTMLPYVIMIQGVTNHPLRLGVDGVVYCCHETLLKVISSGYSYFNILQAVTDF